MGAGVLLAVGLAGAALLFKLLHQRRRQPRCEPEASDSKLDDAVEIGNDVCEDSQNPLASRKRVGHANEYVSILLLSPREQKTLVLMMMKDA